MAANYDKEFFDYLDKNYPAIHPNSAFGKDMLNIWDAAIKLMEEKFTAVHTLATIAPTTEQRDEITCFHCGCEIDRKDFYCKQCGKSLANRYGK